MLSGRGETWGTTYRYDDGAEKRKEKAHLVPTASKGSGLLPTSRLCVYRGGECNGRLHRGESVVGGVVRGHLERGLLGLLVMWEIFFEKIE